MSNHFIFTHVLDNLCKNALDLSNDKLIVDDSKWQFGTYCQWLISAIDDKHYVILEFENVDVRIAELDYVPHLILLYTSPSDTNELLERGSRFKNPSRSA